jgi:hypothetical protein
MGEVTYDKVVKTFVKIRDARAAAAAEFKAKDDELKAQMDRLEMFMLQQMQDIGIESFKTAAGTAYKVETMVPGSNDWDAFYKWVHETGNAEFFFKRIRKEAVQEYMDSHNGETPPGVTVFSKFGVTVRRK